LRISDTLAVRRTLAGLLFGLAYLCAGLTAASFLLQRASFDPGRAGESTDVVLGDEEIMKVIDSTIVDAAAPALKQDPATMRATVELVAHHPDGHQFFAPLVHDANASLIGDLEGAVQLTGAQLVPILRTEAAATLSPVVFDVPRQGSLALAHTVLRWLIPIGALATLVFAVLGLTTHPDLAALMRSLALGLLLMAALIVLIGYLVPRFLVPALSDSPWVNISSAMADDSATLVVGTVAVLLLGAGALLVGTGAMQRRRRWSTPVSTYRYSEERHWS
jgi:hypothetical protein